MVGTKFEPVPVPAPARTLVVRLRPNGEGSENLLARHRSSLGDIRPSEEGAVQFVQPEETCRGTFAGYNSRLLEVIRCLKSA